MQYAAAYQPRIGFSKGTMGDPTPANRCDMVDTALGILIPDKTGGPLGFSARIC
jgi:hypothetical protein